MAITSISLEFESNLRALIHSQQKLVVDFRDSLKRGEKKEILSQLTMLKKIGLGWHKTSGVEQIALGQILATFRDNWDELPETFISSFETFERFAQETYSLSAYQANELSDIWIALYSGQFKKMLPPGVDISMLSRGRQNAAAQLVMRGEMTKQKWGIVSDENLTNSQVYSRLFGSEKTLTGKRKKPHAQLMAKTGEVRLLTDGSIEMLGYFDNHSKNPIIKSEILRILKAASIEIVP